MQQVGGKWEAEAEDQAEITCVQIRLHRTKNTTNQKACSTNHKACSMEHEACSMGDTACPTMCSGQSGPQRMFHGPYSISSTRWTILCSIYIPCVVEHILWTIHHVRRARTHGLWTTKHVQWTVERTLWTTNHVLWFAMDRSRRFLVMPIVFLLLPTKRCTEI